MEIRQLELDLWQSLEAATRYPETANLQRLCDALEGATLAVSAKQRAHHPLQEQLQVAGEMLRQISDVYAARAEWMMSGWEHQHNPQEPIVDLEGYAELFAQSLSLDLGELFEEPEAVMYPSDRKGRSGAGGTVVGLLDKEALLAELDQRLEEHPEMTEAEAFEAAISVAHGEDVSAWVGAIAQVLQQQESRTLSLMEVQARSKMPLVTMWLGVLLGGYRIEQRGSFYQRETIWVEGETETSWISHI